MMDYFEIQQMKADDPIMEKAIDQYLRDQAEDEIYKDRYRFAKWVADLEVADPDVWGIIDCACNYSPDINGYVERLRNRYIEQRIEDKEARADAWRALTEESEAIE